MFAPLLSMLMICGRPFPSLALIKSFEHSFAVFVWLVGSQLYFLPCRLLCTNISTSFYFYIGLIHAPPSSYTMLKFSELLVNQWTELEYPSLDCHMIHFQPPYGHQFLYVTVAQTKFQLAINRMKNHNFGKQWPLNIASGI
jgi:hypothetical protein